MNIDLILKARWYLYASMCIFVVLVVLQFFSDRIKSSSKPGRVIETAQSVQASKQTLYFTNPEGYCDFGNSPDEQEILRQTREMVAAPSILLYIAAPCTELNELAAGNSDGLDHVFQIQLFAQEHPDMSREMFLTNFEKKMPRVETDEFHQSYQDMMDSFFSSEGIDPETGSFKFIGRDENAIYLSGSLEIKTDNVKIIVTSLGAVTLVKGVSVGIYVSDASGDPQSLKNTSMIVHDFAEHILATNLD